MFAVNMPGQRYTPDGDNTLAINPQTYASNPAPVWDWSSVM
jgi:hypothetical protein